MQRKTRNRLIQLTATAVLLFMAWMHGFMKGHDYMQRKIEQAAWEDELIYFEKDSDGQVWVFPAKPLGNYESMKSLVFERYEAAEMKGEE